jgi:hypothetical protein
MTLCRQRPGHEPKQDVICARVGFVRVGRAMPRRGLRREGSTSAAVNLDSVAVVAVVTTLLGGWSRRSRVHYALVLMKRTCAAAIALLIAGTGCKSKRSVEETWPISEKVKDAWREEAEQRRQQLPRRADAVSGGAAAQYEVDVGGGRGRARAALAFRIVAVHQDQKPTERAHANGGDWTFFDAETEGGEPARFTFGFRANNALTKETSYAFGDAWFAAKDRAASERFVLQLAKAFAQPPPERAAQGRAPKPMRFGMAVLGPNAARTKSGALGGTGTWTPMKLFPEVARVEQAEVFINFSLDEMRGELTEKDVRENGRLVRIFAMGLLGGVE